MNLKAKLHALFDGAYYVGIVENAKKVIDNVEQDGHLDIHWINLGNYKGSWFADPFILDVDEKRSHYL